jgi:hypothetical protein
MLLFPIILQTAKLHFLQLTVVHSVVLFVRFAFLILNLFLNGKNVGFVTFMCSLTYWTYRIG